MQYQFTDKMDISGMGGGYEEACKAMVLAGIEWLEKHPKAKIGWKEFKNVYGLTTQETPDTEKMTDYMVKKGAKGDATGAMVQSTLNHVMFIHKNGWDKYKKELEEREG